MEDEILRIIFKHKENLLESTPDFNAAKEITAHVMEFMEWKDEHCEPVSNSKFKGYYHVDWLYYPNNEAVKLEDVYQYWLTNIKNHVSR
jgi:hypothetical protein